MVQRCCKSTTRVVMETVVLKWTNGKELILVINMMLWFGTLCVCVFINIIYT